MIKEKLKIKRITGKKLCEQTGAGGMGGATTTATFQPAVGLGGAPSKSGAFPGSALGYKKKKQMEGEEDKTFNVQSNIGTAKYVVSFHDGQKTHKDGSKFYDIRIFHNKLDLERFTQELKLKGYNAEINEQPVVTRPMPALAENRFKKAGEHLGKVLKTKDMSLFGGSGRGATDKENKDWEERVQAYERQGMTRSDAQGAVDAEDLNKPPSELEAESFQMPGYGPKQLDFTATEEHAKKMTVDQLKYAINDAMSCVKGDIDSGFYSDQISVYRKELKRRMNKVGSSLASKLGKTDESAWIEHKKPSDYKGTKAFNSTQQDSIANPKNKPITPFTGVNKRWGMSEENKSTDNIKEAINFYESIKASSVKESMSPQDKDYFVKQLGNALRNRDWGSVRSIQNMMRFLTSQEKREVDDAIRAENPPRKFEPFR